MKNKTVTVCIDEHQCVLGRDALLSVMIALAEQHARICRNIGKCGDMVESTANAKHLAGLHDAYAVLHDALNELDTKEVE